MEAMGGAEVGRKLMSSRAEASPERGRPGYASTGRSAPARPMRRVQIIYYLCRNGQLEHPHFMELAQHPHQPLRLKDVMDKLTLLRGKGMPALFSWSCKRNYKNGYVWNDLSEKDVIYPSDGVEYVLKGSEIFAGCSSSAAAAAAAADRFQDVRVTDRSPTKPLALPQSHKQYAHGYRDDAAEHPEDDELGYPYHQRTAATARLARPDNPVSVRTNRGQPVELPVEENSPPSSTSSDKPPAAQQASRGDEAEPSRTSSMLLQLIACGSAAGSAKCGRAEPRRSCGLVSRLASRTGEDEEAGGELSRCFSHVRVDEKEYFSGSIVESGGRATPPPSSLKRSNSYNEERSSRHGVVGGIGDGTAGEMIVDGENVVIRGRCIPGRKRQPPPPPPPQK